MSSTLAALTPVLSWLFLNAVTCVILTIPVRLRLYVLPAILIPATISFQTIQRLSFVPGLSELWGIITLIGLIHFSSLLYIKKWTLRATRHVGKVSKTSNHWLNRRLRIHIYKVALNPRFIKVPYKEVVLFEQRTGSQVKSTAIHGKFTETRILWLLVKIGMHLVLNRLAISKLRGSMSVSDFTPAKAVLLRRLLRLNSYHSAGPVSVREIVIRIWLTVNTIWTPIVLLDSIHTALALPFIHVLRIDTPEEWLDLFGSPLEAFTLGRFWSIFWHRLHLSGYSDYANCILPGCMLRNAVVKRVLMTFSLFLFPGLVHQLTSWQLNPGCSDYADLQFFCMNAAAVSLESVLLRLSSASHMSAVQRCEAKRSQVQRLVRVAFVRFVGYTWVVGFFAWSIPRFYYPRVFCTVNQQLPVRQMA